MEDDGIERELVRGLGWAGLGRGGVFLAQLIEAAVLARLLGPRDFGLGAAVLLVMGLGQALADLGTGNAIIHRQGSSRLELSSLYWLNLAVGLAMFAGSLLAAPLAAAWYREPALADLLFVGAWGFVLVPIGFQQQKLLQRDMRFDSLAAADIAAAAAGAGSGIASAAAGLGPMSLMVRHLAAAGTRSAAALVLAGPGARPALRLRWADVAPYLDFGKFQVGERILYFLSSNLDKLLVGRLLGADGLGVYTIAYQLSHRPCEELSPLLTQVAMPAFARVQGDQGRLRRGYLRLLEALSFLSAPLCMLMAVFPDILVGLLLGPGWRPAELPLRILAFAAFIRYLVNPTGSLLVAKGRPDLGLWLNALFLCSTAAAVLAGSNWGVAAVAGGMLVAVCAALVPAGLWILRRLTGAGARDAAAAVLPSAGLALAASLAAALLDRFVSGAPPGLRGVLAVSAAGALYLAGARAAMPEALKGWSSMLGQARMVRGAGDSAGSA